MTTRRLGSRRNWAENCNVFFSMRLFSLFTHIQRCRPVALRHSLLFSLTQLLIFAGISRAQTAPVTLRVASGIAPAGSWAQIQVYADSPGTVLRITGAGFTTTTKVTAEGVQFSDVQFVPALKSAQLFRAHGKSRD